MSTRTIAAAALLSCLLAPPAFGQAGSLTPEEAQIAEYIDSHSAEAVDLLERIVNINSGTLNPEGVRAVYDALAPEFRELGFEVTYEALPPEMGRGGHLVATRRPADGTPAGKKLLLIGHLDTVFEEDNPFQTFEMVNDSTARGPGVSDMKGGDVVIVQALQGLASVGALEDTYITVVMTGDEEAPGSPLDVARAALIEAGKDADIALGFEGGSRSRDGTVRAVIARRSSTAWRLDVNARAAHSSGVFADGVGAGAIYEAARILDRFYAEIRGEDNLTFNVGLILGGNEVTYDESAAGGTAYGKTNVVPQKVVATGDIRTLSAEQLERTRERMRHIVEFGLPQTDAEITFMDGYPSMPPTDANYELLDIYSNASEALGKGPVLPFDPALRGAADVSFVAPYIDAGMDALGVYGGGSHTVNETINLNSMPLQAKRAAILIYRLTR